MLLASCLSVARRGTGVADPLLLSASYLIPSGNAASYLEMRAGNAARSQLLLRSHPARSVLLLRSHPLGKACALAAIERRCRAE
jgi:hypothetical protein